MTLIEITHVVGIIVPKNVIMLYLAKYRPQGLDNALYVMDYSTIPQIGSSEWSDFVNECHEVCLGKVSLNGNANGLKIYSQAHDQQDDVNQGNDNLIIGIEIGKSNVRTGECTFLDLAVVLQTISDIQRLLITEDEHMDDLKQYTSNVQIHSSCDDCKCCS